MRNKSGACTFITNGAIQQAAKNVPDGSTPLVGNLFFVPSLTRIIEGEGGGVPMSGVTSVGKVWQGEGGTQGWWHLPAFGNTSPC